MRLQSFKRFSTALITSKPFWVTEKQMMGETPTDCKNMHSLTAQLLCWVLHAVLWLPVCDQDGDLTVKEVELEKTRSSVLIMQFYDHKT